MALKIWTGNETDGAANGAKVDDIVGTFRSGMKDAYGNPVSLDTWRVSTGDPEVADALMELFGGGKRSKREATGEEKIAVDLPVDEVRVILEGNGVGLRVRFVQRGDGFKILYTSDGETITDADGSTEPDPHAGLPLKERMALAKKGRGPKVEADLLFRLADDPGLGKFRFSASSPSFIWGLVFDKAEEAYENALEDGDGLGVLALLGKEKVTLEKGPNAGTTFTKTTVKILGPADGEPPF